MFCQKCGNQMADDAVFCSKCGTKVEEVKEQKSDSPDAQAKHDNTKQVDNEIPKTKFRKIAVAMIIAILAFPIVMIIISEIQMNAAYSASLESASANNPSLYRDNAIDIQIAEADRRYDELVGELHFIDGLQHWNNALRHWKLADYLKKLPADEYEKIRQEASALRQEYMRLYKSVSDDRAQDMLNKYYACDDIYQASGTMVMNNDRAVKMADKQVWQYDNDRVKNMKQSAKNHNGQVVSPDSVIADMKSLYSKYVELEKLITVYNSNPAERDRLEQTLKYYEAEWDRLWDYAHEWAKEDVVKDYAFKFKYYNSNLPMRPGIREALAAKLEELGPKVKQLEGDEIFAVK